MSFKSCRKVFFVLTVITGAMKQITTHNLPFNVLLKDAESPFNARTCSHGTWRDSE